MLQAEKNLILIVLLLIFLGVELQRNSTMTPNVLCLLFLLMADMSLSAPAKNEDPVDEMDNSLEVIQRPKADSKSYILQGDIAIPKIRNKNADPCVEKGCKWPKRGSYVTVPYYISDSYSQEECNIILRGLKSFERTTCIRFVPRGYKTQNYIHFEPKDGCWSYIGRQRGGQYISLERRGCVHHSTVQHEILHALGFHHEQVRSDRDRYVRILFNNIQQRQRGNFKKVQTNNLVTPYDFTSVMHYGKYDFSSNGRPTIEAKSNPNQKFGNVRQMSANDITRVNRLYECSTSRRQYRY
uniref:Metalloendopeptidase n=2 Tax=Poecilia reticulata TaxID=8081 RepID=A0A3P9PYV3_POERE